MKFATTFKTLLEVDLNKIVIDETEQAMLTYKYPTKTFIELLNKTFESLSGELATFSLLRDDDRFLDAQKMLSDELKKKMNLDIIEVKNTGARTSL